MPVPESYQFAAHYAVRYSEVDASGRLRLDSLCHLLQDIAGKHAHAMGVSVPQLIPQNKTWVLTKLELAISQLPAWQETIEIVTWPATTEKFFAFRDFTISDANGQQIGAASTAWVLINLEKRRPMRLPPAILALHPEKASRALPTPFQKFSCRGQVVHELRRRAVYLDLDFNQHVNNVQYIRWMVESLPPAFLAAHAVKHLQVEFRADATAGHLIESRVYAEGETAVPVIYSHRLVNGVNGAELVLGRTKWQPLAAA